MGALDDFCGDTFWDLNRTWYTNSPDFTPCFEDTVLTWIPSGFLLLFATVDILLSLDWQGRPKPWSLLSISKSIGVVLLILCQTYHLAVAVNDALSDDDVEVYPVRIYTPVIKGCSFILALGLLQFSRHHGVGSSAVQLVFWLLLLLCEIVTVRTRISDFDSEADSTLQFVVHMVYFALVIFQFLLNCWADERGWEKHDDLLKMKEKTCPEPHVSFLSRLLFSWFDPLAWKGYRKPLEYSDLWNLNEVDMSRSLVPKFDRALARAFKKNKQNLEKNSNAQKTMKKEVSIIPCLFITLGPFYFTSCLLKFVPDLMVFASPQILSLFIAFVNDEEAPVWQGYFYASLLFLAALVTSLVNQQYGHFVWLTGMRIRTVLVSAIYKKALVLSNAAKKTSTVGEIVNLMSVDVHRVMEMAPWGPILWAAPMQIIVATYFLYEKLGMAVFAGLGVMAILIPFNAWIAGKVKLLQLQQMKHKDLRVKMMNEILSGIKSWQWINPPGRNGRMKWTKWTTKCVLKVDEMDIMDETIFY